MARRDTDSPNWGGPRPSSGPGPLFDELLAACIDAESTLEVVLDQADVGLQAITSETLIKVRAVIDKCKEVPNGPTPN